MTESHNECYGCSVYTIEYNGDLLYCDYIDRNIDGMCPCTKCVVKMMCINGCSDHLTYAINCKKDMDN